MQSGSSSSLLPVIVTPHTVKFYLGDLKSHKQVLTLYNVYDSTIRFRVDCTNPSKYAVVEPEGCIRTNHSVDILIRHKDVKPSNCNVTDTFRIQILEYSTSSVLGERKISAILNRGVPSIDENEDTDLERIKSERSRSMSRVLAKDNYPEDLPVPGRPRSAPNAFTLIVAAVCIVGLLVPNEGEKSLIPFYLSCNVKLVFAYVLGLVTMMVFHP